MNKTKTGWFFKNPNAARHPMYRYEGDTTIYPEKPNVTMQRGLFGAATVMRAAEGATRRGRLLCRIEVWGQVDDVVTSFYADHRRIIREFSRLETRQLISGGLIAVLGADDDDFGVIAALKEVANGKSKSFEEVQARAHKASVSASDLYVDALSAAGDFLLYNHPGYAHRAVVAASEAAANPKSKEKYTQVFEDMALAML